MAKREHEFKIEKKIPLLPPNRRGRPRESRYPLAQMKVGDSFLVPNGQFKRAQYVTTTVHALAKKLGVKVSTRTTPDGVRVWRMA